MAPTPQDMNQKSSSKTKKPATSLSLAGIRKALVEWSHLSGKTIVDRILEHPHPARFVQALPSGDLFWLIKRVGADDALPLLELASTRQWQYILDLELWQRDRMDMEETFQWLRRLQAADPERLVNWLVSDGEFLTFLYLFRNLQVQVVDKDGDYDLQEGFLTADGVFYVRVPDREQRETIERMLDRIAGVDLLKLHGLLLGLQGVLPAELEEEMFRLRNVRLAEHGFLPLEEALQVYAPLDPGQLKRGAGRDQPAIQLKAQDLAKDVIPLMPLQMVTGRNWVARVLASTDDDLFLERLRIEFAGLCNQIHAADGKPLKELDNLLRTCRRAASHIHLALETEGHGNLHEVMDLVRANPLVSLFRAGFGMVLHLKWEAQKWVKQSWFVRQGWGASFWGEAWGPLLGGLLQDRPLLFCGPEQGETYRDFESLEDLDKAQRVLHGLMGLDRILQCLMGQDLRQIERTLEDLTFRPILFTGWTRRLLNLSPGPVPLALEQIQRLFEHLREADGKTPPYTMPGYGERFISDNMSLDPAPPGDPTPVLEALQSIWAAFQEEYARVSLQDLDARYLETFLIRPFSESLSR